VRSVDELDIPGSLEGVRGGKTVTGREGLRLRENH
jgi:hypothetical protein